MTLRDRPETILILLFTALFMFSLGLMIGSFQCMDDCSKRCEEIQELDEIMEAQ